MASDSDITIEITEETPVELSIVEDTPIEIELVATGPAGADGVGVPTGGTTGQVLAKDSNADYDTEWVDQTGGGGSMEIGTEVLGATPLRALSVDENGDLTDAYLSLAPFEVDLGGGTVLDGVDVSPPSWVAKVGFLDTTSVGGQESFGIFSVGGIATSIAMLDIDTFNVYFALTKNSSDLARFSMSPNGVDELVRADINGFRLGGSGATVNAIKDDASMATATNDDLYTGLALKTYIDNQSGGGGGSPGGSDTEVQFNDGGNFGGDANFIFDKTTSSLKVAGGTGAGVNLEVGGSVDFLYLNMQGSQALDNNKNASLKSAALSDATVDTIASFNGSKALTSLSTSTYPSLTELAYVKGVTSAIQTQITAKLDSSAYDDASTAETNTGTSTAKYVSPDGLAGSYAGTKVASIYVIEAGTAVTTGDGKAYLRINSDLNGMNLVSVSIAVITTSSSGLPTVQLARGRQSSATSAHSFVDMLSTKVTIDATEYDSKDATTPAVIDTANDDVATGDLIRIDVDVAGTGTAGLILTMAFRLP